MCPFRRQDITYRSLYGTGNEALAWMSQKPMDLPMTPHPPAKNVLI